MKIRLYGMGERKRHFRLFLPNFLVFNRTTALLSTKILQSRAADAENPLTYAQVCSLMAALRTSQKCLKGLPLVQVESSDGEQIEIYL